MPLDSRISIFQKRCCAMASLGITNGAYMAPNMPPEQQLGIYCVPRCACCVSIEELHRKSLPFLEWELLVVCLAQLLDATRVADKASACPGCPSPSNCARRWTSRFVLWMDNYLQEGNLPEVLQSPVCHTEKHKCRWVQLPQISALLQASKRAELGLWQLHWSAA